MICFCRKNLNEISQINIYKDEYGNSRKLVKNSYTFFQAKDRDPLPEGAPAHWPVGLIIGMSSGILALLVGLGYSRQTKYMRQLFGVYHIVIGIIYGIPGLVLLFMSFFTDHIVTYHNENLFIGQSIHIFSFPSGYWYNFKK